MPDQQAYVIGEDAEGLAEEGASLQQEIYAALGKAGRTRLVPLAFTIPDEISPVTADGFSVQWSAAAMRTLQGLIDDIRAVDRDFARNFPYTSLRGYLELRVASVARIEPDMRLSAKTLKYVKDGKKIEPFLFVEGGSRDEVVKQTRSCLNDWIALFLVSHVAKAGGAGAAALDRFQELFEQDLLLEIQPFRSQILPWKWSAGTGSTIPVDKHSFRALADRVGRLLGGQEVFPGLGPLKRNVCGRTRASGVVELATNPVRLPKVGPFSLTVRIEVVTIPGLHQPLLTLQIRKRRWVTALADKASRSNISGQIFTAGDDDRVFSYTLLRRKGNDGAWRWYPDRAFEALRGRLGLPMVPLDGHDIVHGRADTDSCQAMLTYREGIQPRTSRHGVRAGVPEIDKLDAFDAIASLLAPLGLKPFGSFTEVVSKHPKTDGDSRVINAPTLLAAAIEWIEDRDVELPSAMYFAGKSDAEIDDLLTLHLKRGIESIQHGLNIVRYRNRFNTPDKDQSPKLAELIEENLRAVSRLYPDPKRKPLLVLFYENGAEQDLRLLQSVIRVLWGNALEIVQNRIPDGAHGPRCGQAGSSLGLAERAALRIEAWKSVAQKLSTMDRPVFCLVMASKYYPNPDKSGNSLRDDKANKPAARRALASIGRTCVQYLLPPSTAKDTDRIDLGNFLHRTQAAMKDLISAHSGRIDGVAEAVARHLGTDPGKAPREIIGITIVRRNGGRSRSGIEKTFLPVAIRLNVATGRCDLRFAHQGGRGYADSGWAFFPNALAAVSRVSPVRLADNLNDSKTRFMRFTDAVITESVESGANPLVIVDSSNCASLWGWLADTRIDVRDIQIGAQQQMQVNCNTVQWVLIEIW